MYAIHQIFWCSSWANEQQWNSVSHFLLWRSVFLIKRLSVNYGLERWAVKNEKQDVSNRLHTPTMMVWPCDEAGWFGLLMLTSSGWSWLVILPRIITKSKLFCLSFFFRESVKWPLTTSMISMFWGFRRAPGLLFHTELAQSSIILAVIHPFFWARTIVLGENFRFSALISCWESNTEVIYGCLL